MNDLTRLREELFRVAKIETRSIHKRFLWLKFAKSTKAGGFRFLTNKDKEQQWKVLSKIADKVHKDFPEFTKGQIVDELCNLINS